jgi:hypothetical protein
MNYRKSDNTVIVKVLLPRKDTPKSVAYTEMLIHFYVRSLWQANSIKDSSSSRSSADVSEFTF